jgi:hypothetical protein
MVKRQGMRAAYYKVLAMVDEAQALINREAVSNNE